MANVRILYDYSTFDAGTVTESSDKERRRGPNVLLNHPGKKWVTDTDSNEWLRVDVGATYGVNCFGVFNHNLTKDAVLKIQGNASDSWSSPSVDETVAIPKDSDNVPFARLVHFFSGVQYQRYWRLSVHDSTNPDSRIEVGRIMAGQYYEFARQPNRGVRVTHKDPSTIEHIGGSIENLSDFESRARFRQIRAEFGWRTDTERKKWETIYSAVGNVKPVVIALDPASNPSELSAYAWIISDLDWVWQHSSRFDVMTVLFEEKTR